MLGEAQGHLAVKAHKGVAFEAGILHAELDALNAARIEALPGAVEAQQAGGDKARADDEDESEADLGSEQDAREDGAALVGQSRVLAVFHALHEAARSGFHGGDEREEQRGEDGSGGGEGEHAHIERSIEISALLAADEHGNEQLADCGRDGEAGGGAGDSEQQAFNKQLLNEAAAGSTKSHAGGQLALAGRAARHQQAGEVEAGEEQNSAAHGRRLRPAVYGSEAGCR